MLITTQDIPLKPLDLQMGAVRERAVPEGCDHVVFDPDGKLKTYAVLDAASLPAFDGPEDAKGLRAECLFNGRPAQDLADCAPYLVALEHDHAFTRDLFTRGPQPWQHWGREAWIILQSQAPFEALRDHLRRFTKLRDAQNNWFFLRFYMPLTMEMILHHLADAPNHLIRWFAMRDQNTVARFLVPSAESNTLRVHSPDMTALNASGQPPAPFMLDSRYDRILRAVRTRQLEQKLARAIQHDYQNLHGLNDAATRDLVRQSLTLARREGLRSELALGQFAAAGYLIGRPLTPAHLQRIAGYTDLSAHENRRTRALLDQAERSAARANVREAV